jgi:hypothetical protein
MAAYFRIKELTAPATVLRQGNLLGIDLGDFIYPEEVPTIVCTEAIVYWDDNTCEHFTWTPGEVTKPTTASVPNNVVVPVTPLVEEVPLEGVVPSDVETGSEDTQA